MRAGAKRAEGKVVLEIKKTKKFLDWQKEHRVKRVPSVIKRDAERLRKREALKTDEVVDNAKEVYDIIFGGVR